jgi:hypothetical protein
MNEAAMLDELKKLIPQEGAPTAKDVPIEEWMEVDAFASRVGEKISNSHEPYDRERAMCQLPKLVGSIRSLADRIY